MRWAEISLEVPRSSVEPVSAAFTETGCSGVAVTDPAAVSSDPYAEWIVRDQDAVRRPDPECIVRGYLPVDDRLDAALHDFRRRLGILEECGIPAGGEITLRTVDEDAWADAWKAYFKPLRVGRHFVVKPSWESWDAAPGDRIIEIDPGMAFGSGLHPTTRLCLQLLEAQLRGGEVLLDWGTGSGILSLGAALLGAREIVALDLDPVAVRVAAENAGRNGFADRIHASTGSIEALPPDSRFDFVVANIVADPIILRAGEIARCVRPGGQAVVSGIIDLREAEVVQALQQAGLELQETLREEEWRAFRFARP